MTTIKSKHPLAEDARKYVAKMLCNILAAGKNETFEPFQPNGENDPMWVLDSGNDWRVTFLDDNDPRSVRITYRYSNRNDSIPYMEQALCAFITHRMAMFEPYVPPAWSVGMGNPPETK